MALLLRQIDEHSSTISTILEEGTDLGRTVRARLAELVETGLVRFRQSEVDSKFSYRYGQPGPDRPERA